MISKGKSLLCVGITDVNGEFKKGDLISCINKDGIEIARGLSNFDSKEINLIKGINSEKIQDRLGYLSEEEVIHRNNLVLV